MRIPDNSQTFQSVKPCENPECDKVIPLPTHRIRGENVVPTNSTRLYHDNGCRSVHTQNSRQTIRRLKQVKQPISSNTKMLNRLVHLGTQPPTFDDWLGATWWKLQEIDTLLQRHGPVPQVRDQIGPQLARIRRRFVSHPPETSDETHQYIHCLEAIVDRGADHSSEVPQLRRDAWEVAQYYFRTNDHLRFCKALMTYAHNWRLDNHHRRARDFYSHAYNLLTEYRGPQDVTYFTLLHNATRWHLRCLLESEEPSWKKVMKAQARLVELAVEKIGTPTALLETRCEIAGLLGRGGRYRDEALEEHARLEAMLLDNIFPEYGLLSLLRPKIHILLETGSRSDRDEAIAIIKGQFLKLYEQDRHFYYYAVLMNWKNRLGLSINPSNPVYGSGILVYLPRN